MNVNNFPPAGRGIRCRRIEGCDVETVVTLLTAGFGRSQGRSFWQRVFERLNYRTPPADHLPKYGYLLETDNRIVGTILLIFSKSETGNSCAVRCNVSSWYVEPAFRAFAPLLASQALKHKNVTYINTSAAPHTRPIAEVQGYIRYADGIFISVPLLSFASTGEYARVLRGDIASEANVQLQERDILLEHAEYGCISLWCVASGTAYPFVFRSRRIKGPISILQLIYCPNIECFIRFARPLGIFLALRGQPLVIIDSNGPIRGLAGKYFAGSMPKYYKGPDRPRLGDLAYTETAMFGL
jgi:hypothetical protein